MCLEDPRAALDALESDQRELAEQFEETTLAYQERVVDLASRLKDLRPEEVRREAKTLRDSHDSIRRILRRLEASALTSKEIEHELKGWEARRGEQGPRHADHPEVRAEILRSELSVRGHGIPLKVISIDSSPLASLVESELSLQADDCFFDETIEPVNETFGADSENLISAIRHANREVERWHESPEINRDAIDEVKELRRLHALLKQSDRESGVERDRMPLAVKIHGSY
jgi:hypothetical protein